MLRKIQPEQIALFDAQQNGSAIKRERERERGRRRFCHAYDNIISVENLLASWQEFLKGKRKKKDVAEFSVHLMSNIFELHKELKEKTYRHGSYHAFIINDPKTRSIHKAKVRDRLLHHAIHRILYPFFDSKFIHDSYSCRISKGTHRAIKRFDLFARKVSKNNTKTAWVLKCDIKKFFANIDHRTLKVILDQHIADEEVLWLLGQIIDSFNVKGQTGVGLPLGNLTSQLLINVYMNEFDQFVKHVLKVKYYIRYADDFVFLHSDRKILEEIILKISVFLEIRLKLSLHPNKVHIKTLNSGVDFLGWVNFQNHRVLRTKTKNRMLKNLNQSPTEEILNSYLGLIRHGNTHKLRQRIIKDFIFLAKNNPW